jgi:hypothetical protein
VSFRPLRCSTLPKAEETDQPAVSYVDHKEPSQLTFADPRQATVSAYPVAVVQPVSPIR